MARVFFGGEPYRVDSPSVSILKKTDAFKSTAPSSGGERCNGSGRAAFFCQRVKTYFEVGPFGRKTYF